MAAPKLDEATIFNAARRIKDPDARRRYVAEACGDDLALAGRVEALLGTGSTFLRSPSKELGDLLGALKEPAVGEEGPPLPRPALTDYELLGELGRGGMGVVYKARQVGLNRLVALKMVLAGRHAGPEELARFRIEAEAVAALQHPNIVQIYEIGERDGLPFFSLELVEGGSLADRLTGTPWSARPAAELVAALARAMHYAHARGVVHRDLKPANVLLAGVRGQGSGVRGEEAGAFPLTPDPWPLTPVPKITDFGLAKLSNSASGRTHTGDVMGTPSYMAPEQAGGKSKEMGPACDIYALGAILYDLLTGRPPFKGETALDTLELVRSVEPVPVRQLQPKVPRDLETICLKCLAKEPRKRYGSAQDLAEDLERFGRGEPVRARPVGRLERTWRWCRRNPALAAALTVAALALLLGTTIATWFAVAANAALANEQQARTERALAQAEALLVAGPEAVPALLAGLQPLPPEVRARLRAAWEQPDRPENRPRRLRAGLGLLAGDAATVKPQLSAWLLDTADPREFLLLRNGLLPYGAELQERLWKVADAEKSSAAQRFRALVALAAYDPDNARWPQVGPQVVEEWLSANPLHVGLWTDALRPVGQAALLSPLMEVSCGRRLAGRREAAATILADYAADRPELLAELVLEAEPRQWAELFPKLAAHRERALPLLRRELARPEPPAAELAAREALARRQAQAAVGLLQLGAGSEQLWGLLRQTPQPDRRTYLLLGLGRLGTPVELVLERLEKEHDAGALQALVLSLGEYGPEQLPAAKRGPLVGKLLGWYRTHPDAGLHGAIDWLLRHARQGPARRRLDWGQAVALAKIDAEQAGEPAGTKGWYVTAKEGHTLAVVRGPVEFVMGSPVYEPVRIELNEPQHRRLIGRSFAIATREVTVAQFRRFLEANPRIKKEYTYLMKRFSPEDEGPQVAVTWFQAAAYCNWLSQVEGLPKEEWVYGSAPIRVGMELPRDWRTRKGYRLPTEAEWEYACRAGTETMRYHGNSEGLLGEHAWYLSNSEIRAWPVGQLRPNGLGLFDMLGNAQEWCQDRALIYPKAPDQEVWKDTQDQEYKVDNVSSRVHRGMGFADFAPVVRCAGRSFTRPAATAHALGLRVARTYE